MEVPSMVCARDGALIVRSLVSGDQLILQQPLRTAGINNDNNSNAVNSSKDVQEPVAIVTSNTSSSISSQLGSNAENENEDQSSSLGNNLKIVSLINNNNDKSYEDNNGGQTTASNGAKKDDTKLPQCKIKRNYSCNNCNYFTQNPRRFLMHLRDTHGERITINECKLCLYASRHYQKLVRHMRMVHGSTEGINEPNASRRGQGRGWKLGRKRSLEEDEELIDEPNFIPNGLNEADEYKSKLEKCTMCSFTTLSRDSLIAHEREDHAKTKFFRCHKCSYVTHIKARFSKHVKYHSMPMIKCMMCDFRTPYKWNLDRHMKNHGGAGPFKCSACSFSADIKQSLTVHETNHHIPPIEHNSSSGGESSASLMRARDWPEDLSMSSSQHSQDEDLPLDFTLNKTSDSEQQCDSDGGSSRTKKRPIPNLIPIPDAKPNESTIAALGFLNEMYLKTLNSIMMFANKGDAEQSIEANEPINTPSAPQKKSIFDKFKENMVVGMNDECHCGYKAKSLTDMLLHQNQCVKEEPVQPSSPSLYGSTRCQYCRHRCKTTDDLLMHMRICEAKDEPKRDESSDEAPIDNPEANDWGDEKPPMNFMDQILFHNIEEVNEDNVISMKKTPFASMKKVFKCPHCSFWASTASRFHVHIVGHLNKKPFECSLCAYRSNWRWDITKHIRLKTVRDINHKNARVLMNDETGRRNYTKYNKYVTLMGVNETDVHSKQSKSEDSALSPTEIVPPSNSSDTSGSSRDNNLDALNFSAISQRQQRFLAQLHQQQPQNAAASVIVDESHSDVDSNNSKKTNFKCKKCSFKSYDRDEVLGHVKQHYIDAGLFVSPIPPPSTPPLINIPLPQLQQTKAPPDLIEPRMVTNLLDIMPNITLKSQPQSLSIVPNGENSTSQSGAGRNSPVISSPLLIMNPLSSALNTNPSTTSTTTLSSASSLSVSSSIPSASGALTTGTGTSMVTLGHGGLHRTSTLPLSTILAATSTAMAKTSCNTTVGGTTTSSSTTSTTTSEWRGPAPYRCGHCHQVSNWKHVIQRHCRLKHGGVISIEHLGKTSNGSSDNRRRPRFQTQTAAAPVAIQQSSASVVHSSTTPLVSAQHQSSSQPSIIQIPPPSSSILASHQQQHIDAKRYKCQFCPYESNSKSQLQYHVSFHQQKNANSDEVYTCTFCTYSVTRRHLLLQHLKMHSGAETVDLLNDDTAQQPEPPKKQIFYCSQCPARYMSKTEIDTHVSMHDGGMAFRCKLCTYTAATDSNMQAHVTVHSTYYQEKTREFQRKYQGNIDFPPPKVALANVSDIPSTSGDTAEQFWICEPRPFLKIHERHLLSLLTQCKFCPYTANAPEDLKTHVVHHKMFSNCTFEFQCEHCDYSSTTKDDLVNHKKLHFLFISNNESNKGPALAFYTNYEKLELKCMDLSLNKQQANMESEGEDEEQCIYKDDDRVFKEKVARLSAIKDDEKMIIKLE